MDAALNPKTRELAMTSHLQKMANAARTSRQLQEKFEKFTAARMALTTVMTTTDGNSPELRDAATALASASQEYIWAKDSYDAADRELKYAEAMGEQNV